MSTIAVAKKNGIAAIGADTLTSCGEQQRERMEMYEGKSKLLAVGESTFAVMGNCSWPLVLTHYLPQMAETPALDSQQAIFNTFLDLHRALKEDYFLCPTEDKDDEFEPSQLNCLIANPSGIYGIDTLRSVLKFSMYYAMGAGDMYALGAMRAVYPSAATAEEVVRAGLEAACYFDGSTGLPLEIRTVKLRVE